ncbi:hypothetical protein [Edaphobacter albus]|uniref:hypothetical protein n=1 Tax=Edaphobacter sp. 4G125 TaxID=2763071 RepID=UPI0016494402|nr:hypothetical protein [Edaphobacter sp. 4G125]QNI38063.1 hypothetical protein H7846_07365 [Edaphobacter sp. 4G125]
MPHRTLKGKTTHRPAAIQILCLGFFLLFSSGPFSSICQAQTSVSANASSLLSIPPRDWVAGAVENELKAIHDKSSYLRYRMHIVDTKGDQVRDVIESKDGTVARLILRDGKPLTEEQDKAERERLNNMLRDPQGFAKHVKNSESGKKIADQLIRLMPDAMLYTYAPGQPQTGKNPGITEVVIDYVPNPKFHPPSTTAEALTGLKGRAWFDPKSRQVLRLEGNIFRGVNFGWGMLAHIYPGGQLTLEQADAGNGRWTYTHFRERITIRALMVKTLDIKTDVDAWNFQEVPLMSYQEAIQLLLNTPLPTR